MAQPGTNKPIPRPSRKASTEAPRPANGHDDRSEAELEAERESIRARAELSNPDHPLRRMTRAVEELHSAATELQLAPMRLEWADESGEIEIDPAKASLQRSVEAMLADYEALRAGPIASPLPDLSAPTDPHSFLVQNLIRPGSTVMLAGPPGAAKSWLSRQLALGCGAGTMSFLDHYAIAHPMNVLVIDEDNGPDEEWRRDEALLEHLQLSREAVRRVRRVSLEGVRLDEDGWQRWLRGQIRLHEIELVILDPISEMHGGKELREDASFRGMLAFLKRLKVDFPRMATIIVHHTRKLAASDRVAARGLEDVRGQWGQTPDVVAMMSPLGNRRSKWEVHKRVPHSSLILEQIAEGEAGQGALRYVSDEAAVINRRADTDTRVLSSIDAGAATADEIALGTGLSKPGVYKALTRLAEAGLITRHAPFERLIEPREMLA